MNKSKAHQLHYLIFSGLLFFIMYFAGCSSAVELQSELRKNEIKVDGDNADWHGVFYNLKDEQVSLKVMNDDKYLYLCLITHDRRKAMMISSLGLTVWFDNSGGTDEIFGIHFPIGLEGGRNMGFMNEDLRNRRLEETDKEKEEMIDLLKDSFRDVEILGPGKHDIERVPIMQLKGINIGMRNPERSLIYELRIPLYKGNGVPYAINADLSKPLGIGIKTGKFQMDMTKNMGAPPEGGSPGGNMPPGGMGGMNGRSGGRPNMAGNRAEMPKQLDMWFKVSLAK